MFTCSDYGTQGRGHGVGEAANWLWEWGPNNASDFTVALG